MSDCTGRLNEKAHRAPSPLERAVVLFPRRNFCQCVLEIWARRTPAISVGRAIALMQTMNLMRRIAVPPGALMVGQAYPAEVMAAHCALDILAADAVGTLCIRPTMHVVTFAKSVLARSETVQVG